MAVVRNLMIRAGADFSKASKAMGSFQKSLGGFQSKVANSMRAVGAALAMAGASLGLASATKSAMEYESAVLQINRTMQTSAKIFQDWAKTNASSYGMAQVEAMKYAGIFSNLISGFAKDTKEVQEYTTELLKAGAITASATGRTIEDTMDRIRSGMLGSTEAIEDLGINVNIAMIESTKAFQQFANGKSWAQLSFQTQQQIRLFAILEQATSKYGDEVANSTAAKQAMFVASLKNVQLAIGQAFLPIYNIVLPALTRFANALSTAINFVAQFTQALFGKSSTKAIQSQTAAISSESKAVDKLGNSINKTSNAAKGMIAGFDELNQFSRQGAGAEEDELEGLGLEGMSLPGLDAGGFAQSTVEVSEKVQTMVNKVKAAYQSMSDFIKLHSDIITAALAGVGVAIAVAFGVAKWGSIAAFFQKLGAVIAAIFSTTALVIAAVALAIGAVVAAFIYFYKTNEKFKGFVDGIFQAISNAAVWLWDNVLVPFSKWLIKSIPIALEAVGNAITWLWTNVIVPFSSFLLDVFKKSWEILGNTVTWLLTNVLVPFGSFMQNLWTNVLVPVGKVLVDVLASAFKFVSEVAKSLWQNVLIPLGEAISSILKPAVEALSAVFNFLWNVVLVPLGNFMSNFMLPLWKTFTKTLNDLWHNTLKPIATFVGGVFLSTFENVFISIGSIIDSMKTIFIGLMEFISGVFTGDWQRAWEGVRDIFKGIFDSLYGIVKFPLNQIIDAVNLLISGLNSISFNFPDWVPNIGGKSFGISIPKIPKLARGGIVDGSTNFGNFIAGEAGTELILPLENTSFVSAVANAIGTAVTNAMQVNSSGNGEIVLNIDGTKFARVIGPYQQREIQRKGVSIIAGGV